jgi:MFS transporter, FHS family, glucose/mannose:H+ symporter
LKSSTIKNYLLESPYFISLFTFNFYLMLASPILIDMSDYFKVSPENMNLITSLALLGQVIGTVAFIFLERKFNVVSVVTGSFLLLIPVLIGLILTTSLSIFYSLYFFSGFLAGIILMDANIGLIEGRVKNKDSVVNLGYSFFAIGAIASPIFSSSLVDRQINWKYIYLAVIALVIISLICYIFKNKVKKFNPGLLEDKGITSIKELLKNKDKNIYLIFTGILMFFAMMTLVTVFSWSPTFFRTERAFDLYSASMIVFLLWIGILIGRLLMSFLSYKLKTGNLLMGLSVISIGGLALLIFPRMQTINLIGALVTGLGFSGIIPLLVSSTGVVFGSEKDVALTVLFVLQFVSGGLAPFIIRFVARYSFFVSMLITILFMAILAIFVIIRKYYRKTLK